MNFEIILRCYGLDISFCEIAPLGTGLINTTWVIYDKKAGVDYVLQKVNQAVFQRPQDIAYNIRIIGTYLKKNHPGYLYVSPLKTVDEQEMFYDEAYGYFRLFPFVKQSCTLVELRTTEEAYQAAKQFGKFTFLLSDFEASQLRITIPDFHNIELRFEQFLRAVNNSADNRKTIAGAEIAFLSDNKGIVDTYTQLIASGNMKLRVTHHDTKVSNVLFDNSHLGLCVIDLDTVMPGYYISDVGDMFRTFLSPANEEEKDFDKVTARAGFFEAVAQGYLSEMSFALSNEEKRYFVYAGEFIIYMQALRFLSDYLNGDIYYQAKYPDHNLNRAKNQIRLLQSYCSQKAEFEKIVKKYM